MRKLVAARSTHFRRWRWTGPDRLRMEEFAAAKGHPAREQCAALPSLATSHLPQFQFQFQSQFQFRSQTPDVFCPEDHVRPCQPVKAADPPSPLHERCIYRFLAIRPVGDPQLSPFDSPARPSLSSPSRSGIPPLLDQSITGSMAFQHLTSQECPLLPRNT
jgi:hypothetical protein